MRCTSAKTQVTWWCHNSGLLLAYHGAWLEFTKRCDACQFHTNFIHQPQKPLHRIIASWLFKAWGLDVVGPFSPKSAAGHLSISGAIHYLYKWPKMVTYKEIKKRTLLILFRRTSSIDMVCLDMLSQTIINYLSVSWWLNFVRNSSLPNISHQCIMHLQMA